jgi:pyridoxal biosynthesis lyase PdxS
MAEMLKGGVTADVVTADQAKIAEDAGAVAVWRWSVPPTSEHRAACRTE